MLGLCLYVPVSNSDPVEVECFESNGLPSELKSLFNKLSVFLPSQELSTYQKWRKVRKNTKKWGFSCFVCQNTLISLTVSRFLTPFTLTANESALSGRREHYPVKPYDEAAEPTPASRKVVLTTRAYHLCENATVTFNTMVIWPFRYKGFGVCSPLSLTSQRNRRRRFHSRDGRNSTPKRNLRCSCFAAQSTRRLC